jgi:hypothetical protein
VAFLALTLNPRRDDHDNPADEREVPPVMWLEFGVARSPVT